MEVNIRHLLIGHLGFFSGEWSVRAHFLLAGWSLFLLGCEGPFQQIMGDHPLLWLFSRLPLVCMLSLRWYHTA